MTKYIAVFQVRGIPSDSSGALDLADALEWIRNKKKVYRTLIENRAWQAYLLTPSRPELYGRKKCPGD